MGFLYIKNKLRGNQLQFQWLKVPQSKVNLCTRNYKWLRKLLKTLINEKRPCVNILEEQTLLKCQYSNSCLQSWCHTYQNSNDIIHIDKNNHKGSFEITKYLKFLTEFWAKRKAGASTCLSFKILLQTYRDPNSLGEA